MPKITVYRTRFCPFCDAAEAFLKDKGIPFEQIDVSNPVQKWALKRRTGWMTVPQIFIGEEMIGGYQELVAMDATGDLEKKLASG